MENPITGTLARDKEMMWSVLTSRLIPTRKCPSISNASNLKLTLHGCISR